MGLFQKIFGGRPATPPADKYEGEWKLLGGTEPRWRNHGADLYESELIRAAINAIATHCSKLNVVIQGSAKPALRVKLQHAPNEYQTWSQFFYRLSTILTVQNNAFIAPVFDQYGQVSGIFSLLPSECDVVSYDGKEYLRYKFRGETAAIELENCGIMTTHQYRNDLYGESNAALKHTADLIDIVNQGIEEGVKNSASYRFMARTTNWNKDEDLAKERERFGSFNFSKKVKSGGLLLFPNTYQDIKQIDSKPYTVDAASMKVIRESVFDYFGVNEEILKNEAGVGDKWSAFYEGKIEPFAIQFSEVVTKMLYTFREQSQGNRITATANRIQYMSNSDKLAVTQAFGDRGLASIDEIREIWNLPPLPDGLGETIPVRGEYYNLATGKEEQTNE